MGAMGALAIAGPIGLAVGALLGPTLGKALGGLFGTKTTIKGQGLYGASQDLGSIVSQGFNLQEYVDIQTKKKALGITTSKKNSTRYSDANQELENQFSLIFTGFYDSIVAATGSKLSAEVNQGFTPNTLGKLLSNPTTGSLGGMLGGGALGATLGVSTLMGGLGMVS